MSNTTLTADVVAKTALAILENELGVVKTLHRAYEDEFDKGPNGYKVGDTIRIRRPADFTVRTGAVVDIQDVIEGRTTLVVDQQLGVDFKFTSTELTLSMNQLAERVIKPAMSNIVNTITSDVLTQMYRGTYNWVGTPGQTINSFADFAKGPERLDEMAVPMDDRTAVLAAADHWAMLGSQTALYIQDAAKGAYRSGSLGEIGGVRTLMSQVVPSHTTGTRDDTTPTVNGADQNVTYDTAKNTWTQSLICQAFDASSTLKAGDVFTLANVFMVNPKTKVSTGILQQFVNTADATASGGAVTLTISPPIIISGPHQTVNAAPASGAAIVNVGSASTAYKQNMVYHKNAMALAVVPMEMPQGVKDGARESYKGFSVRVIPGYDFVNDISRWRLDILYGRKLIDPRLITRLSGTA